MRDDYAVTVFLASSRSGNLSVYRSQCTCPVAMDCKHAAAVLIVARHLVAGSALERPEWERTLDKLLAAEPPVRAADVAPLALEFGVERIPAFRGYLGRQDLRIRPARRSRSGGWVRSGISWDDLDFVARSYVAEQRELLLQFRAAAGASARYALPRSAWLSLGTVSSAFWGLLDQAAAVGLTILAAKPLLGPLRTEHRASVVLDAHRDPSVGLLVGPRVLLDDRELELSSLGVLGDPAHGIFHVSEEAVGVQELIVARLDQLLSRELRQLLVDPHSLLIPSEDEPRFLADFVPRLRQKINITSADRSVRLPDYVEPILGLTVNFRPEHRVRLDWMAHYDRPTVTETYAIDDPLEPQSIRDLAEEQRKLAALPLPYADLPQLASSVKDSLVRESPQLPAAHVLLDGKPALQFVEHVMPQLALAGVRVRQEGEVREYRSTSSRPQRRSGRRRAPGLRRLVRFAHQSVDRRRDDSLRGFVRRSHRRPRLPDLGDRSLFLLGSTGVHPATRADRGIESPARSSSPRAEHQPVPGESVGRPDQPRRCHRSVGSLGADRTRAHRCLGDR